MKMQPLTDAERQDIQRQLQESVNGKKWICLPSGFSLHAEGFKEGALEFRGIQRIKPPWPIRLMNWLRGKPTIYQYEYRFTVKGESDAEVGVSEH